MKFTVFISVCVILCCQVKISISDATGLLAPVILIPGDGGSQVEAKLNKSSVPHYFCSENADWFDLWVNAELLLPVIIDCWVDNMMLYYDNVTRKTHNSPGVEIRIPGFGNTSTVEYLDPSMLHASAYFADVVNAILPLGYKRNVNIRGAPFDFRKAPNESEDFFKALKKLIEDTVNQEGTSSIVIVHSMGAPVFHYFLIHQTQEWKDKYIRAVISLSGAWGGSIKAIKVYACGDNLGILGVKGMTVRPEQRSAPSLAFLLPSPNIWSSDEIFVETPNKNYTLANFRDFFYDIKYPNGYEMYMDTHDLLRDAPPPGVELHCLYGINLETTEKLTYKYQSKFPDDPILVSGDGDGTVNRRSAEMFFKWVEKQRQKIFYKTLDKVDHMGVLRTPESLRYIYSFLKNVSQENAQKKSCLVLLDSLCDQSIFFTRVEVPVKKNASNRKNQPSSSLTSVTSTNSSHDKELVSVKPDGLTPQAYRRDLVRFLFKKYGKYFPNESNRINQGPMFRKFNETVMKFSMGL